MKGGVLRRILGGFGARGILEILRILNVRKILSATREILAPARWILPARKILHSFGVRKILKVFGAGWIFARQTADLSAGILRILGASRVARTLQILGAGRTARWILPALEILSAYKILKIFSSRWILPAAWEILTPVRKILATTILLALLPPAIALGSSAGSSESLFALVEAPNVETQLNRLNVGVNLLRVSNVMLYDVPVSQDAAWIDTAADDISAARSEQIMQSAPVRNNPYYATIALSNAFLGQTTLSSVTPVGFSMYNKLFSVYKNPLNSQSKDYRTPDLYAMPNIFDAKSFSSFPSGGGAEIIQVEALSSTLYKNAYEAAFSLCPESFQEDLRQSYSSYKDLSSAYEDLNAQIEAMKADKEPQDEIRAKEAELASLKKDLSAKQQIYEKTIKNAASALALDLDPARAPLAHKLDKLFETLQQSALEAMAVMGAASLHLAQNGFASLEDELRAITLAGAVASATRMQKNNLERRAKQLTINAIYALPNLTIGLYRAGVLYFEAGRLKNITSKFKDIK
ncbi:MAG: hypothetical protein ACTTIC_07305 [Helicobacteraceae bacterium]